MKHVLATLLAVSSVGWVSLRARVRLSEPQADTAGFVARTYTSAAQVMPYRLFMPKAYDAGQRYPLIVWLHGADGKGTDNVQQISGDQLPGTRLWIAPENQATHPAFVVAPQSAAAWSVGRLDAELQPDSRLVVGILDSLGAEFAIDRRRVYLVGQSNGAGAAWNLLTNAPSRFAAVVLVAPAIGNITRAADVSQTPLWLLDGEFGAAERVRTVVDTMRLAGGHSRVTVYPGEGHNIWTRAFAEPDLVGWLFAQQR